MIKLLKALLTHAPKNDMHYYLNGVHLRVINAHEYQIEVTDGHKLIRVDYFSEFHELPADLDVIIDRASLDAACKYFGVKSNHVFTYKDDGLYLGDLKLDLIDGRYPDCNRVIPDEDRQCDNLIGFNLDYMASLCKSVSQIVSSKKAPCGNFCFGKATESLMIKASLDEHRITAVITPVRL